MSLRARDERGNLVAIQGEDARLRDCFVPRNDKKALLPRPNLILHPYPHHQHNRIQHRKNNSSIV